MNIHPDLKAMIAKVAPGLNKQIDDAERSQIAFSEALLPEQQDAMRKAIEHGPEAFIFWARTERGKEAIREAVDKFIAVTK